MQVAVELEDLLRQRALTLARKYYTFGVKMVGGLYNTSDDPFLVNRYYVSRYANLSTVRSYLSAAGT